MESILWNRDQALLHAPLLTVTPAVVYVLIRGRNAWHSTWVTNYKGTGAVYLTLDEAKRAAEKQRVQGSVFYIRQVPAVALNSREGTVVMVEFHSDTCFGNWDSTLGAKALTIGTPMSVVIAALGRDGTWRAPLPSRHSYITVKAAWNAVESMHASRRFTRWASQSQGPRIHLTWDAYDGGKSRSGVNAVIRAFTRVNDEDTRRHGREEHTSLIQEWNGPASQEDMDLLLDTLDRLVSALGTMSQPPKHGEV